VHFRSVLRPEGYLLHRWKAPRNIGPTLRRNRLRVKDQRVLREIDGQRERGKKRDRDCGDDFEGDGDQVLW